MALKKDLQSAQESYQECNQDSDQEKKATSSFKTTGPGHPEKLGLLYCWAIIFLLPVIFILVNSNWAYPLPHFPDAYYNTFFALNFDNLDPLYQVYKIERVSWLIPLHYFFKVLTPHQFLYWWALFSSWFLGALYFVNLKKIFGQKKTLIILPFILLYPHLNSHNTGWGTYHSVAVAIYSLMALFFFLSFKKDDSSEKKSMVLCGVFLGSAFISSILSLSILVVLPALEYFKYGKIKIKNYLFILLGCVGAYLFWSALSLHLELGWVSWSKRLSILGSHLDPATKWNTWYRNFDSLFFLKQSKVEYLCLFFAFFIWSFFSLWHRRSLGWRANSLVLCAWLLLSIWFFNHAREVQTLDPPDFIYPLLIPVFLCFPVIVNEEVWKQLFEKFDSLKRLLLSVFFTLVATGVSLFYGGVSEFLFDSFPDKVVSMTFILLLAMAFILLSFTKKALVSGLAVVVVFLSFAQVNNPYKSYVHKKCQVNEETDRYFYDVIKLIEEKSVDSTKSSKNYNVFFSRDETLTLKGNGCREQTILTGWLFQYISLFLKSEIFQDFHQKYAFSSFGLASVDDKFFYRVRERSPSLVVVTQDFQKTYSGLKAKANEQGHQLILDKKQETKLAGNSIWVSFFKLESL